MRPMSFTLVSREVWARRWGDSLVVLWLMLSEAVTSIGRVPRHGLTSPFLSHVEKREEQ